MRQPAVIRHTNRMLHSPLAVAQAQLRLVALNKWLGCVRGARLQELHQSLFPGRHDRGRHRIQMVRVPRGAAVAAPVAVVA
eukprot:COSAG02_NODE_1138_length_14297_cov_4.388537_11_plen_81_part_00